MKKIKLLHLTFVLLSSLGLKAQNLVVTLTNSTTETFAVANIQSIKFGTLTMTLYEMNGTVTTWYINDIDNYTFNGLVGITESTTITSDKLEIFPNPTSDKITIKYKSNQSGAVKITVYDTNGIMVEKLYSGIHNEVTLITWTAKNISAIQSGNYLIKVDTENKMIAKPFIVQ
jgi:hypothetical protein